MSKSNVLLVDIVAVSVDATCDLVNVVCTSFCTISLSTATVNVSLPPSLPSVKSIPSPATNLPFKYPAVVSDVAIICSGDAGIYAMGALVYELLDRDSAAGGVSAAARRVSVVTTPGISALQAAAARSGAILGHDFCTISLSDLLTPWDAIETRIHAAGAGDFVIAFYNPVSRRRRTQLAAARDILLGYRGGDTPVLLASNLGRPEESLKFRQLGSLDIDEVDMLTVVMVGSSSSRLLDLGRGKSIYTPRGYANKNNTIKDESKPK